MPRESQQAVDTQVGLILKKFGKNRFLMLGICGVIALLAMQLIWPSKPITAPLLPSTGADVEPARGDATLAQIITYRQELEKQIAELLMAMQGVGEVQVMVSLDSGPEAVPAMNVQTSQKTTEEQDSGGGTRVTKEDSTVNSLLTGNNQLMVLQEKLPTIGGVVIVAQGASKAEIRLELARAVQTICNVPIHLVQVVPGK